MDVLVAWPNQYHYDHDQNWNRWLFGIVHAWCDCFFVCCMIYCWAVVAGDEPHVPADHPDACTWLHGTYELLSFIHIRKWDLDLPDKSWQCAILPHANVRKRDLVLPDESRQLAILMCQIGGKFFTCSCIFSIILLTQEQLTAPLFERNRFVIYATHLHTNICYVCNMWNI